MSLDPTIEYSANTAYFSCIVEDYVKIIRPEGFRGVVYNSGLDSKVFQYGFEVMYPKLGELISKNSADSTQQSWVIYHHKKSGQQVIKLTSDYLGTNEFFFVLRGITIHDHASIYMGGPAFATYYSEPTVPTDQEGSA